MVFEPVGCCYCGCVPLQACLAVDAMLIVYHNASAGRGILSSERFDKARSSMLPFASFYSALVTMTYVPTEAAVAVVARKMDIHNTHTHRPSCSRSKGQVYASNFTDSSTKLSSWVCRLGLG